MARTGTTVAMCPVTAAKGARGAGAHGRLPELLAKGVKVALGCDSPNNSNHLDIVRALNMAAIQYKDARQDITVIPAETALELATLTGAQALGVGDEIGSLEPGKKADLVLFDTQRPEWQTMFNPINNLVYNADGRSMHTVIVDGRVVVDAYRQTFVDEPQPLREGAGDRREAAGAHRRQPPPLALADRLASETVDVVAAVAPHEDDCHGRRRRPDTEAEAHRIRPAGRGRRLRAGRPDRSSSTAG